MKKRQILIREFESKNRVYSIVIDNVGLHKEAYEKINKIIKNFAEGSEFFFGHYRKDGIYLTKEEMIRYSSEIPAYFKLYGDYYPIEKTCMKSSKRKCAYSELTVCRAPNDERVYKMFNKIFNYYLETIFFCPKISWETFIQLYKDYMKNTTRDYVLNGYADFLFSYVDSGDFGVSFDPNLYEPKLIRKIINKIMNE